MTFSASCFICDGYISDHSVSLQLGRTSYSNTELPQKLSQLIGDGFMVVVSKDDEICANCFNLINNADKLEEELLLVKKEIIGFLRLKYQLTPIEVNTDLQELNDKGLEVTDKTDLAFLGDNDKGKDVFEVNVVYAKTDEALKEYQLSKKPKDSFCNIGDRVQISAPEVKNVHKCRICGQVFQSRVCVRRHIMYSHLKWVCCYCNINFDKKCLYNLHMKTHNNELSLKSDLKYNKPFVTAHFHCNSCNFKTSKEVEFNNHICDVIEYKNHQLNTSRNEFKKHGSSNSSVTNIGPTVEVKEMKQISCVSPINKTNSTKVLSSKSLDWEIEEITFVNLEKSDKLIQTNVNKPINESYIEDNNHESQTNINVCTKSREIERILKSKEQNKSECNYMDYYFVNDGKVRTNSIKNQSSEGNLLPKPINHIDIISSPLKILQKSSQEIINEIVINKQQKNILNSNTTENEYNVQSETDNLPPEISKTICNKENEIKIHTCEICRFNFISEMELKNHIETNHSDIITICPICFNNFVSVDEMHRHLQKFHGCIKIENGINTNLNNTKSETEFLKTYKKNNNLLPAKEIFQTNLKVNLVDGVQCPLCKIKFKTEKRLEKHLLNFHKDLVCKFCGKEMINMKTLKMHEKHHLKNNEHQLHEQLQCNKCGKNFKTKGGLRCHYASHTGNFKYCCDFCGRGFMSRMALEEHRSTHTKEERFVCDVCGKKFCLQSTYWIHRKWHDNPFPYKCNYCNRVYKHSSVLAVHKRTHTGERPYKCTHCPLSFPASGTLKRHLVLHTQQFPFNCKICQKGFTTRNKYAKHLAKLHSNFDLLNESSKPKDYKMAINNEPVDQSSELWEFTEPLFNLSVANDIATSVTNDDLNSQILQIFL